MQLMTSIKNRILYQNFGQIGTYIMTNIKILTTNDIHGRFLSETGTLDFSKLRTYKESQKNCLLFDAGDATQGTPLAIMKKGIYPIKIMNSIGYDGIAIGNHEFDNITKDQPENELDKIIEASAAPYLACNICWESSTQNYVSYVYKKAGMEKGNGRYLVKSIEGKNLLFIGVTTPISTDIPRMEGFLIKRSNDITNEIRNCITDAKKEYQKIDMVILLAHLGLDTSGYNSRMLAKSLNKDDNVRLIIDGHSHKKYDETINDIKIMQADCNGKYFGIIDIQIGDDNSVDIKVDFGNFKTLENYPQDTEVKSILDKYNQKVKEDFGEIRATSLNTTLWGGALDEQKPYILRAINISRFVQTNLGEFTSAALIHYIRTKKPELFHEGEYIIAGRNGGGVRNGIAFGKQITDNDLFYVLPSHIDSVNESGFKVFRLTMKELYQVLANSVSKLALNNNNQLVADDGRLLNTSGIRYTLVCFKPDPLSSAGHISIDNKVYLTAGKNINQETKAIELRAADSSETVLFVVDKYLAQGGDGYTCLKDLSPIYHNEKPLYRIAGEYMKYLSKCGQFYYAGVINDVSYRAFDFPDPNELTIYIEDESGSRLKDRIIIYSFCGEDGYGKYIPTYLGAGGCITVKPPKGASVLCIAASISKGKKDFSYLYGELFLNSYFSMTQTQVICQMRENKNTLFSKRSWMQFKHTSGNISFYSNYLAYFNGNNEEYLMLILENDIYIRKNHSKQVDFMKANTVEYIDNHLKAAYFSMPFPEKGISYKTWGGKIFLSVPQEDENENSSPLYGYTYSKTTRYYDGELTGRNHNYHVCGLYIRSGQILDGFGFIYPNSYEFFMGFQYGGAETRIIFDEDEYITKITGEFARGYYNAITQLNIETNKRTLGSFGSIQGGESFEISKKGHKIYAFKGEVSIPDSSWKYEVVNKLGAYFTPIN